jgi:hypothetical protein
MVEGKVGCWDLQRSLLLPEPMLSKVEARLFGTLDIDTALVNLPKSKNAQNGVKD